MKFLTFIAVIAIASISCTKTINTPIKSGVLLVDVDCVKRGRLVMSIDRLSDVEESFSKHKFFAIVNGIEDVHNHILVDEKTIILDEDATCVYGKIQDIEREFKLQQNG